MSVLQVKPEVGVLVTTVGKDASCNDKNVSMQHVCPTNQEEADTRLILHAQSAVNDGHTNIVVRTVDSDVLVLCVVFCSHNPTIKLWIELGTGKNVKALSAHNIALNLGIKSHALPFFHAFTGCETVSSFSGRDKKSAWKTWMSHLAITDTFTALSRPITCINTTILENIERFVIKMYDKTCQVADINDARRIIFIQKKTVLLKIYHRQKMHFYCTQRATFQTGHI